MPIRITSAIEGFRRAGVSHPKSPSTYSDHFFTEKQLAQLEAEPRLVVEHIDADQISDPATDPQGTVEPDDVSGDLIDATLAGVVDSDGKERALEDMTVAELRELAIEMEISGAASLRKAELVEAIKAETVQVTPDQEQDA